MRSMIRSAVAMAALLAFGGSAPAGELDNEFGAKSANPAAVVRAPAVKASELDAESPTQACRWRCGWGCGWRSFGWGGGFGLGYGGGFSYYRGFGYGVGYGFRYAYPAYGYHFAPVYYGVRYYW